jgi:hypothetical protein
LEAVPGIEEEGDFSGWEAIGKVVHRLHQRVAGGVARLNDVEAEGAERVGNILGIVGWVLESGDRLVSAVADDQGEALAAGGIEGQEEGKGCEKGEPEGAEG